MNMRVEIILNIVDNTATFSPSSWDWRQCYTEVPWYMWIVSRRKPRMAFKTLFRAATHHRLRVFALGRRTGNGCIVQIIILWSDIHCSHYSSNCQCRLLDEKSSPWNWIYTGQSPCTAVSVNTYLQLFAVFPPCSLLEKCQSLHTQFILSKREASLTYRSLAGPGLRKGRVDSLLSMQYK